MSGERPRCPDPLCLVVEDLDGSFALCDSRGGELLGRRRDLGAAGAAARMLNCAYPLGVTPPAPDTLAHQLARDTRGDPERHHGRRAGGKPRPSSERQ